MVIQQGGRSIDREKLADQKGMKRDMIRFGAEHILSSKGSDIIDVDLEKILKDGALKAAEEDKTLTKLTLGEASSVSLYQFEGVDFRLLRKNRKPDDYNLAL